MLVLSCDHRLTSDPCFAHQVADWLDAQGLGMYRQIFLDNDITGENLLELGKVSTSNEFR